MASFLSDEDFANDLCNFDQLLPQRGSREEASHHPIYSGLAPNRLGAYRDESCKTIPLALVVKSTVSIMRSLVAASSSQHGFDPKQ